MKLRIARHTSDLSKLKRFYETYLALEVLNSFEHHEGFDGIMMGIPRLPWELEFTVSDVFPSHEADTEDQLIFYPSLPQFARIFKRIKSDHLSMLSNKNPYWSKNAITISDPDGYQIVIVRPVHEEAE